MPSRTNVERLHRRHDQEHLEGERLHVGVRGEQRDDHRAQDREQDAEHHTDGDAPLEHAPCGGARLAGVLRAEEAADHRLSGDGERVERQPEEQEHLERDLVGGDVVVADARRDCSGGEERGQQRAGTDHEPASDTGRRTDPRGLWPHRRMLAAHRASDNRHVGERGTVLRKDRPPGRPRDPKIEAVHEEELDDDVRRVRHHGDYERGARVLKAAEIAGAGQGDQQGRRAEDAEAQVRLRERVDARRCPHRVDDDGREGQPQHREADAEAGGQPDAVDAVLGRGAPVPRPDLAGDRARGRIGEEVEDRERRRQHRARDRQPGERVRAQMPDDGGVDEDVERLRRQGPERGQRQPDDLSIVRAAAGQEHPGDASDRSRARRRDSATGSVRNRRAPRAPRIARHPALHTPGGRC